MSSCETANIDGVEVMLDEAWIGPSLHRALNSGSYEREERAILSATLSAGDTYLELGCGIGVLATMAAARVGADNVVAVEADPAIATVARETAARNGYAIDVRNLVLLHEPAADTVHFYARPDFRLSSLSPPPETDGNGESPVEIRRVQVPTVDARRMIAEVGASYLMVDIEGGEIDLLRRPLPDCVQTICVELHPKTTGIGAQSEMLAALLSNGFDLDVTQSALPVLLFRRKEN